MEDTLLLIPDEPMESPGTVVILTADELDEWLADLADRALVLDANGQLWIVAEPEPVDAVSAVATRVGVEARTSARDVDPHVRWTTHTYADALPKPLTVLALAKAGGRG